MPQVISTEIRERCALAACSARDWRGCSLFGYNRRSARPSSYGPRAYLLRAQRNGTHGCFREPQTPWFINTAGYAALACCRYPLGYSNFET